MSKTSLKAIIFGITTFLLFVACSPLRQNPVCELSEIELNNDQAQKLNISVYVDGSGSMLGYVTPNNSAYIQGLKILGDTLELSQSLHPEKNIIYYRNGQSEPEINRSEYREAQKAIFYNGTNSTFPSVSSPIHQAVTKPSEEGDDLIVIVTDLEQDQGAVIELTKNIKENYLNQNKGYSVGIWALKSEFQGKVYIEGFQGNLSFTNYSTANKSVSEYRPFYVLFIGRYEDIKYYFDKISSNNQQLTNSDQGHLLIFNPHHVVSELASIKNLPELPQGLDHPVSLIDGNIQVSENSNNPYHLLKINSGNNDSKELNFSLPVSTLKYTLPIDINSLEVNNLVKKFDGYEESDDKFVEETENPSLKDVLEISNLTVSSSNNLDFTTIIKSDKISNNLVNLYEIDINVSNLESPTWWSQWSWQSINNQNGSKTQNLERFLDDQLKEISLELINQNNNKTISVGKLCYAIQKK